MRLFNRHASHLPLQISPLNTSNNNLQENSHCASQLENISHGGIRCQVPQYFAKGTVLIISIPDIQKDYQATGIAAWCNKNTQQSYDLGINFKDDNEAFNYRMVEQICHIERYRRYVLANEQRQLSSEQAAAEWIEKYAHKYPQLQH